MAPLKEAERLRKRHPDRIPAIFRRHPEELDLPNEGDRKLLLPDTQRVGQIEVILAAKLNPPQPRVGIWSNATVCLSSETPIKEVDSTWRSEDGFLYLLYRSPGTDDRGEGVDAQSQPQQRDQEEQEQRQQDQEQGQEVVQQQDQLPEQQSTLRPQQEQPQEQEQRQLHPAQQEEQHHQQQKQVQQRIQQESAESATTAVSSHNPKDRPIETANIPVSTPPAPPAAVPAANPAAAAVVVVVVADLPCHHRLLRSHHPSSPCLVPTGPFQRKRLDVAFASCRSK
mmetsp:Transcript_11965/g.26031  ORF Transcript_11965/g.26031 Transcript_11965/m.26031 type:complete len:283 (-) Transcript_11965:288-1136(-)